MCNKPGAKFQPAILIIKIILSVCSALSVIPRKGARLQVDFSADHLKMPSIHAKQGQ